MRGILPTSCAARLAAALLVAALALAPAVGAHNTMRTGSVSCTTASTAVLVEHRARVAASLKNNDTVTIFIGTDQVATLTTANGYPLDPGQQWFTTPGYTGPVNCIVAASTANLRFVDEAR